MTDTTQGPTFRPAVAEDETELLELEMKSWDPGSGFPSAREGRTEFFNERNPPGIHTVAVLDGKIAGYIRLTEFSRFPEGAHAFILPGLAVAPEARGMGVGAALLADVERQVKERGGRKITLSVLSTNTTAKRLYERAGYVVEGVLREQFRLDGEYVDDIVMGKFV